MELIKFNKSHSYLDSIGVPRLEEYKSNVLIDKIDFTEQENVGNIDWRKNGVFLNVHGNFQRGFMYIKHPNIEKYGLPKFHLLECQTIISQKQNGRFHNHYFWSNSPSVTLTDRQTNKIFKNKELNLCGNCSRLIRERTNEEISNTDEFHKLLDINDNEIAANTGETRIDIQGRPYNWRAISKAYREQQNYTCENCGFGGDNLLNNYDKRYIHTHHIDGYSLLNTHRNNLRSLCVLCHCKEDEHHESNFEKPRLKLELDSFVTKYRDVLIRINNPYINDYTIDETN